MRKLPLFFILLTIIVSCSSEPDEKIDVELSPKNSESSYETYRSLLDELYSDYFIEEDNVLELSDAYTTYYITEVKELTELSYETTGYFVEVPSTNEFIFLDKYGDNIKLYDLANEIEMEYDLSVDPLYLEAGGISYDMPEVESRRRFFGTSTSCGVEWFLPNGQCYKTCTDTFYVFWIGVIESEPYQIGC
ncbi:MAG TPA: hypothetical protein VFD80_03300 [Flavobacteriaceae bacterium]|nr:hypothetical protein [Flavobacteriaceae bacterium]